MDPGADEGAAGRPIAAKGRKRVLREESTMLSACGRTKRGRSLARQTSVPYHGT